MIILIIHFVLYFSSSVTLILVVAFGAKERPLGLEDCNWVELEVRLALIVRVSPNRGDESRINIIVRLWKNVGIIGLEKKVHWGRFCYPSSNLCSQEKSSESCARSIMNCFWMLFKDLSCSEEFTLLIKSKVSDPKHFCSDNVQQKPVNRPF